MAAVDNSVCLMNKVNLNVLSDDALTRLYSLKLEDIAISSENGSSNGLTITKI